MRLLNWVGVEGGDLHLLEGEGVMETSAQLNEVILKIAAGL